MRQSINRINISKKVRINDEIRVPNVRLILSDGSQAGVVSIEKALAEAEQAEEDLVEVSPNADPPVCKIIDFGKFLYKQQKSVKKQAKTETKGIRLSLRISQHDMEMKIRHAEKFLTKGNRVKVTLLFKGREVTHQALGFEKINAFVAALTEVSEVEQTPKRMGYTITAILKPLK